jgi:signal transduction histidine kinase
MKVVTKLRVAFALYITLLAVLLTYHVTTIQGIVETGHELTAISSRVRATSTEQVARITQLGENAAKFLVTQDRGYLNKFNELYDAYDTELKRLEALPLSEQERQEIQALTSAWLKLGSRSDISDRLIQLVNTKSPRAAQDSLALIQAAFDSIQYLTQRVGEASQVVMSERLQRSGDAAREAERLSWISAIGVLLLSLIVSALIARSISEPLNRLTEGTQKVAAGQFDYRLDINRGDEFAQVAKSFNTMTRRLGDLDRMKRDFVSQISHDLKTPLTSMQETISALLDEVPGPLTEQQRTLLVLHQQSGQRLASMLAKLLDLSRLEAGIEPDLQMIEAGRLIHRAVEQASPVGTERSVEIVTSLPEHQVMLKCDADRMLQLLDNLLENAIKFSPSGGVIEIKVVAFCDGSDSDSAAIRIPPKRLATIGKQPEPYCAMLIAVSDQGPGIPDDQKERVFDRFYQTDVGKAVRGRGVGLGLTICREIVGTHKGTIWVSDNPGGGSVFNVLLPGALCMPTDRLRAEAIAFAERYTI